MRVAQTPDYAGMNPRELSDGDLGRWEIWDAVRRSGRSMRELSLEAEINESGINQLLSKTQFVPQPATLRALSRVDILGLSYMRLMTLFGHIDPVSGPDELDHSLEPLKRRLSSLPRDRRAMIARYLLDIARMFDDACGSSEFRGD